MIGPLAYNTETSLQINKIALKDLFRTFDTTSDFQDLDIIGRRLSSLHGLPQPTSIAEAIQIVLTTCMHHGQATFIVDYVQEICADPKYASTNLEHQPVLDGNIAQAWLQTLVTGIENDLETFSGQEEPHKLPDLHCAAVSAQLVNYAIKSAGLNGVNAGLDPDRLLRCHQMVTVFTWLAIEQLSLHESSSRQLMADFELEVKRRRSAAQTHNLSTTLSHLEKDVLSGGSYYPFPNLLIAVKRIFLGAQHGSSEARIQLFMYYLWDCGHDCDWQGLTDLLGIQLDTATEWHSLATLERLLITPSDQQSDLDIQTLMTTWRNLSSCPTLRQPFYAAQLLNALGHPTLALRMIQPVLLVGYSQSPAEPTPKQTQHCEVALGVLLDLNLCSDALSQTRLFVSPIKDPVLRRKTLQRLLQIMVLASQLDDNQMTLLLSLPFTHEEEAVLLSLIQDGMLHKQYFALHGRSPQQLRLTPPANSQQITPTTCEPSQSGSLPVGTTSASDVPPGTRHPATQAPSLLLHQPRDDQQAREPLASHTKIPSILNSYAPSFARADGDAGGLASMVTEPSGSHTPLGVEAFARLPSCTPAAKSFDQTFAKSARTRKRTKFL